MDNVPAAHPETLFIEGDAIIWNPNVRPPSTEEKLAKALEALNKIMVLSHLCSFGELKEPQDEQENERLVGEINKISRSFFGG